MSKVKLDKGSSPSPEEAAEASYISSFISTPLLSTLSPPPSCLSSTD